MFNLFYEFYYSTLLGSDNILANYDFALMNNGVCLDQYLCELMAFVSCILVYVACVMFILKIVKVVGRLFTGA